MRTIAFGLLAALSLNSVADACCQASAGPPVWMTHETALIIWDAKNKVEHFVRQANFETKAKEFGFIVPLPSVPEFGVANQKVFERLNRLIPVPPSGKKASAASAKGRAGTGGAEIIKTERVGDYEATVVRASDGNAMGAWLKSKGFVSRPAMTDWLHHYANKNWVFAALKYVAKPGEETNTNAIRISFKTDKPHYPYKMPTDAFRPGWTRPLKLFVVAPHGIAAKFSESDANWAGQKRWAGDLPENLRAVVAKDIMIRTEDIPANATVTVFENASDESKYDEDLVFMASTSIGPYLFGGFMLVLALAWGWTRRNKIRAVQAPA